MVARIEFGEGRFSEEAKKNLARVLENTYYPTAVPWPESEKFAQEWGEMFGYKHNVPMASGTSADIGALLALYAHGAERGDEVILPALAWISVLNAPLAAGFTPVFADVEKETLNINPRAIEEKITPRTRAIMAVHTMGKPCEMDTITDIAKKHDLYVIEDSCEAHGAKYKGKFVGQWGDAAAFSFYMAHIVWAGEGGMISTNNAEFADSVRAVKNHGRISGSQYMDHILAGLNLKMSDLHAAVGRAHLKEFQTTFNKRKENLTYLLNGTSDLSQYALFNSENPKVETVAPHGFSLTLRNPEFDYKALYDFLQKNSINCKRNFGSMPTQHRGFGFLGHKLGEFPEAEYIGDNGLHIGVHQALKRDDLDYVVDKLHEYFARFK